MITILLARHGQASFGQENYDQLSELGVIQAKRLGEHYGHTQRRIDAIFSGSLVRQRDSAEHFCQAYLSASDNDLGSKPIFDINNFDINNLESCVLPIFDEFNHEDVFVKSNPTLSTQAQIAAELTRNNEPISRLGELFGQAMQRWHSGAHDDDYLESWPQFSSRALQALDELSTQIHDSSQFEQDSTVLVFTSGGVIAAITAHLLKQSSATAYQLTQSSVNTGVTSLTIQQQKLQLLSYNEHSHLFSSGKSLVTKH